MKYDVGPDFRMTFPGKPSEAVRRCLRSHGMRWNPQQRIWWRRKVSGAADVVAGVQAILNRESGVRRPDGACWQCKCADGYFRNMGAAAPVLCDACYQGVK